MAITTIDGLVAGMLPPEEFQKTSPVAFVAGRYWSSLYAAGFPGPAVAPSSGTTGSALTTYAGQIPFTNPGSGNTYLARFTGASNLLGTIAVCDRLWHNSGIVVTSTASQTISSTAWPARDQNGSTDGVGVKIALEVSTVMGAGTPTITMVYVNSSGTTQTTTTAAMSTAMAVGSFIPIPLAAGDVGVRSVVSWTQSATMTSGVYHLVAYRMIARIGMIGSYIESALDPVSGGMPRLYDNTVPWIVSMGATTTAPIVSGQIVYAQG